MFTSLKARRSFTKLCRNIEYAGFEIRDQIMWLYGSGFPKSHDVSKGIDKAAGAEREVMEERFKNGNMKGQNGLKNIQAGQKSECNLTAPATEAAKQWQGWGTALKPANEPIVVARKPLEKGLTVAQNVLKYGTGALNIDASRIQAGDDLKPVFSGAKGKKQADYGDGTVYGNSDKYESVVSPLGRWPANVLLDEESSSSLDLQVGDNVSRFFYVAKASKRERSADSEVLNNHPTVKPIKLMEYLIKLVTPELGTVLDPFAGSGTTLLAAIKNDYAFIGIERESEYVDIIRARVKSAQQNKTTETNEV
jgi:hypothetical protein